MIQWVAILVWLCVQSTVLALLLLPGPAALRRSVCNLLQRVRTVNLVFLLLTLVVLADVYMDMRHLEAKRALTPGNASYEKETVLQSRLFRAERNVYLTAFCSTVSLVVLRVSSIVADNLALRAAAAKPSSKAD